MKKKFMQFGRSMVEMLGVLAVVGVLSILALGGYKKAIDRARGNELIDMAMKTYQAGLAKVFVNPDCSSTACYMYWRSSTIPNSQGAGMNIGGDKPSWIPLERFNILVSGLKSTSYHQIAFYSVGSCELCKSLETVTEQVNSTAPYRILPGTKRDGLPNGVRVYCYEGSETSGTKPEGSTVEVPCFP